MAPYSPSPEFRGTTDREERKSEMVALRKTMPREKPTEGIGERMKAIRLGRGYSLREVAERVGVTFQQIHKYEAGQQHLTVDRLLTIAETLDVSPVYLLEGANEPAAKAPQNRLREFREARRMTQTRLAQATNTTRQNIRLYEQGISDMTVDWLIRLGRALQCHPWALVDPDAIPLANPSSAADSGDGGR